MKKLILAMSLVAVSGASQLALGANSGKVTVCHKGQTVSINSSGLRGHEGHGDTQGSCENRKAAVVVMQCKAQDDADGIAVVKVSSSPDSESVPEVGGVGCATALADLLDARMAISAVTATSDGKTEYTLTGYVSDDPTP